MAGTFGTSNTNIAAVVIFNADYGGLGNPVQIQLNFGAGFYYKSSGSGALEANTVAGGTVQVSSGTPTVIDLNTVTQPDGSTATFADLLIVGFYNHGDPTSGETLTIGGGTNPVVSIWSANLVLLGGTPILVGCPDATGYAVNASTAHKFTLNIASGTNVDVDYLLVGH